MMSEGQRVGAGVRVGGGRNGYKALFSACLQVLPSNRVETDREERACTSSFIHLIFLAPHFQRTRHTPLFFRRLTHARACGHAISKISVPHYQSERLQCSCQEDDRVVSGCRRREIN